MPPFTAAGPPAGSPPDIHNRIVKFFKFWLHQLGPGLRDSPNDVDSTHSSTPHDIDTVRSDLSEANRARYGATELYDASGFLRPIFGRPAVWATLRKEREPMAPPSFWARAALKGSHNPNGKVARANNALWEEAQKEQERFSVSIGDEPTWVHPLEICGPRTILAYPGPGAQSPLSKEMQQWRDQTEMTLETDRLPAGGLRGYWKQLPGRLDIADEIPKGSPSTPLFSLLRLQLVDNHGHVAKTVLVRFLAVQESNGLRPWRRTAPTPPLPAAAAMMLKSVKIALLQSEEPANDERPAILAPLSNSSGQAPHLRPMEPPVPPQHYRSSANLKHYRGSLGPTVPSDNSHSHSLSLTHRQRFIYGQELAQDGSRRRQRF